MKRIYTLFALLVMTLAVMTTACKKKCDCKKSVGKTPAAKANDNQNKTPDGKVDLSLKEYKMLYFMAYMNGKNLKRDGMKISTAALAAGAMDGYNGKAPKVTQKEIRPILMELRKKAMERLKGKMGKSAKLSPEAMALAKKNEKAAKEFMAKNKTVKGVIEHPKGFQYKILHDAKGPKPTVADKVTCHYKGTLLNGKKFDSSYDRGAPTSFSLSNVIQGWKLGIPLMSVGSKFIFWIPGKLAYGMHPPTPKIGPMDMLVFEVELVAINGKGAEKKDGMKAPAKKTGTKKVAPKAMK